MTVRTRFAPSPTGFLHVGSVRTALFSWLFAKHCQGQFILRIEDTDHSRSTKESVEGILAGMSWLGLAHDEGPFHQTDRYDRYQEILDDLLKQGHAYRCECSKERLEALRQSQMETKQKPRYDGHCRDKQRAEGPNQVIRFKNPVDGTVAFTDHVYGDIVVNNAELDDFIMLRSDGHYTYNFVVVVDDMDMNISHVIRGDDHINNTPRQINLFKALKVTVPDYAHLPSILGEDGKRLSKRHGAVNILEFKEEGILPQALLNYLVRLGWSHGDQEIFSLDEMIKLFDLDKVSRAAATFNHEKLEWLNQHYVKTAPLEEVEARLLWQFEHEAVDSNQGPGLKELICLMADRSKTLGDLCRSSKYFYQDEIEYDEQAVKKHLRPVVLEPMKSFYQGIESLSSWEVEAIQGLVNDICVAHDLKMPKIAQPIRVAVTGNSSSPSIDKTLHLIGKDRVIQRLKQAISMIEVRAT